MKKRLDPKNDIVFQKLFGCEKNSDLLINLLNAILKEQLSSPICWVEFLDRKMDTQNILDEKIGILDVRVKSDDGSAINIEIQLVNQYNMIKRTLFYLSKMYLSQIARGRSYNRLNKTVTVNILNYNLTELEKYHSTYNFFDIKENYRLTDLFEIHIIELKKFKEDKTNKNLDVWTKFLIDPNSEEMEGIVMENEIIQKAKKELDYLSSDYETVRLAELREKAIMDYNSGIEGAREEGIKHGREDGIKHGREEGEFKKAIEIAKKMLSRGSSIEDIVDITGLAVEEIQRLTV